MTDQEIVDLLTVTGHMSHPHGECVSGLSAVEGRPTASAMQAAIASYQEFHSQCLDPLCLKHHGRVLRCDGKPGDATHELWAQPRCECPDYGPDVQAAQEAQGSGNWKGCHNIGEFHAAKVYFDNRNMSPAVERVFDKIWSNVVAAYDAIGLRLILTDKKSDANITVSWQTGRTGWIGLAIVGHRQTCGGQIWVKISAAYTPTELVAMLSGLLIHEFGHSCGLQHTRGGLMNPYLLRPKLPVSWTGDPSHSIVVRKFGGKPVGGGEDLDNYWTHQILRSPSGREKVVVTLNPPIKIGEDD